MWPPLLSAVVTLGLLFAPDVRPAELVRNAATEKELSAAIVQIEASGADLGKDLALATSVCEAWERLERPERARALLDALKGRVTEQDEPRRLVLLSAHLLRAGNADEAVAAAREALERAHEQPRDPRRPSHESDATLRLAEALEAQGSYREAIAKYEEWRPAPSFCSTGETIGVIRFAVPIARCRAALGEIDAAMDGLFAAATHSQTSLAAMRELCVLAARHDRMPQVRTRLAEAEMRDIVRQRLTPYLAFGDAMASRDPAALRNVAAAPGGDSGVLEIVSKAYSELGDPVIDDLCKRIVRGERVAIQIAEHGRIRAARRAVLSRAALTPDRRECERLERVASSLE